jgi:hypothetical protein
MYGGLPLSEEEERRVAECRDAALQELRRGLGLTYVLGDLPILPDSFNDMVELGTREELDGYIKQLELASHAAGYIRFATPDRTPPNTPPSTPPWTM